MERQECDSPRRRLPPSVFKSSTFATLERDTRVQVVQPTTFALRRPRMDNQKPGKDRAGDETSFDSCSVIHKLK